MSYNLILIFSFSVIIPAIIGWIRFTKISPTYYPFVFCIWLASINEPLGFLFAKIFHTNVISTNIYYLIEFFLFIWQFYRWGVFGAKKYIYYVVNCIGIIVWVLETLIMRRMQFSSYFLVAYSFVLVLLSTSVINDIVTKDRRKWYKNAKFIICSTFILFYTYQVIVETFWIYGVNIGPAFRFQIYHILSIINLISNLLYALAILWIPARHHSLLQSS